MQKIDLSDGYWCMIVEDGAAYNFVYLLPPKAGEPQRIMLSSQLVMGWTESAAFFTTASQAAADLSDSIIQEPNTLHNLGSHPLEHHTFPVKYTPPMKTATPIETVSADPVDIPTPQVIARLLKVFIDDFCHLLAVQGEPNDSILAATRALLHSIHAIFPPPEITGHCGGKDPISAKKLEKGDAQRAWEKDLLGFLFDGYLKAVRLLESKASKYTTALKDVLKRNSLPLSTFQKLHGKIQHVAQIMPAVKGILSPLNA
jgi:hypothetical protein